MKSCQSTISTAAGTAWRSFLGLTVACAAVATATAGDYIKVKPYAVAVSPD